MMLIIGGSMLLKILLVSLLQVSAGLLTVPVIAEEPKSLKVGDAAPAIVGVDENSKAISHQHSDKYTLVYFYPKADTPGCTAQACSLRDAYAELTKKGVTVFGVSLDTPEKQLAFKKKHNLPFTLIADTEKKLAKAFGVPTNFGFTSRQAFLMKAGKIVWIDREASTKDQAKDVLDQIK